MPLLLIGGGCGHRLGNQEGKGIAFFNGIRLFCLGSERLGEYRCSLYSESTYNLTRQIDLVVRIVCKFTSLNVPPMSPLFLDAIALTYRPDLDVLILRWPQPVYAFTAREVYQQVLELAKDTHARYWLFDVRSRGPLSQVDVEWLRETYFPALHGQLGHITHVAYLVSPAHANDLETKSSAAQMRSLPWYGQGADFEGFTSETQALLWLKKCQLVEVEN